VPYTIVQATQFFEFLGGIANAGAAGSEIRLSQALVQPIAAEDVAAALAEIVTESPSGGRVEIAGPEAVPLDDLVRRFLAATGDARQVVTDANADYFGVRLDDRSLTPAAGARLAPTGFEAWFRQRATA
jgi:uncharacterized protein YbjT (DUF2867 family)